jgi:hypothetical protein
MKTSECLRSARKYVFTLLIMTTLSGYFKLHVIKQVYKWILLCSEVQNLECAGCVPQRRRKNSPFFRGFYPEDGGTSSPDLQNHSRKNLKSHTLTLHLWKLSPIYAAQVPLLLRDGWQTMACRQHTHLNLWRVISKGMQRQTLTGGYCTWGCGKTVSQNKRAFVFAVVLFRVLLMTKLLIRGQFGGNIKQYGKPQGQLQNVWNSEVNFHTLRKKSVSS